jgi:hypothetical protein
VIVRIRLKAHPDRYVGRDLVTYALVCDEERKARWTLRGDTYFTGTGEHSHAGGRLFVPQHKANTWTKPGDLKRTLSSAAHQWYKWHQTTWTAYEAEDVETGEVMPLDAFLLAHRKKVAHPKYGEPAKWRLLKKQAESKAEPHYAIAEAIRLVPECAGQRQDSLTDQMTTVMELARRAGCWDAYDHLKRSLDFFKRAEKRPKTA